MENGKLKSKIETHGKKLVVVWLHGTEALYLGACTPCNMNVISLHSVTLMICFHGNFFSKKA